MSDETNLYYEGAAIHGYGGQWLIGQGTSPETYVAVKYVTKITPGDMNTAVFDKTHLRSPGAHKEKKAGLRDSGPFAIELMWNPTDGSQSNAGGDGFTLGGLIYLWRNRIEREQKLVLSDGTEWPFKGVITKFQPGEIGLDGGIPCHAEVTPLTDFSANLP